MKKRVKEVLAAILPTEYERQLERLRHDRNKEVWSSFMWGFVFGFIICLIACWAKS